MIYTGSTVNFSWQYSEKDHTKVLRHTIAFGLFRAVTSMNTFRVVIDIFDFSELMIGGTEHTCPSPSKING